MPRTYPVPSLAQGSMCRNDSVPVPGPSPPSRATSYIPGESPSFCTPPSHPPHISGGGGNGPPGPLTHRKFPDGPRAATAARLRDAKLIIHDPMIASPPQDTAISPASGLASLRTGGERSDLQSKCFPHKTRVSLILPNKSTFRPWVRLT
jgi:hypothetical protein